VLYTTLRPDNEADKRLYGKEISATEIIQESKIGAPESAHDLMAALQEASPRLKS
jgi:hypothetical protein